MRRTKAGNPGLPLDERGRRHTQARSPRHLTLSDRTTTDSAAPGWHLAEPAACMETAAFALAQAELACTPPPPPPPPGAGRLGAPSASFWQLRWAPGGCPSWRREVWKFVPTWALESSTRCAVVPVMRKHNASPFWGLEHLSMCLAAASPPATRLSNAMPLSAAAIRRYLFEIAGLTGRPESSPQSPLATAARASSIQARLRSP